jgi:Tetratricopeptide repeat.
MKDENRDELYYLAAELLQEGDYNASKSLIDQFLSNNSENASALNIRGIIRMNTGAYDGAKLDFLNALNKSDNQSELYTNLGLNSFYQGNMNEADEYFSHARSNNTSSFVLLFYSGLVKYALGSYDEAVNLFNNASVVNPNDSATWFNLGMSYEQVKKFDLAVKAYDHAIRIDPGYGKAWFFKGRIYQSFGNASLARMAFENYTFLAPEDDLGWFFYAKSLHDDDKNDESTEALRKAIEIDPDNQMYNEFLKVYEPGYTSFTEKLLFERPSDNFTLFFYC